MEMAEEEEDEAIINKLCLHFKRISDLPDPPNQQSSNEGNGKASGLCGCRCTNISERSGGFRSARLVISLGSLVCCCFLCYCCESQCLHISGVAVETAKLRDYADASRSNVVISLKKLEEANPKFHQKLAFPSFSSARLITMLNQSLNMQHSLWENWRQLPEMETLSNDHGCKPLNATMASTSAAVYSATVPNCNVYTSLEWTVLF